MAKGITPGAVRDYVLRSDRELPEAERTIWKLRALSLEAQSRIEGRNTRVDQDTGEIQVRTIQLEISALVEGLAGVENFLDENGQPIEFESEPATGRCKRSFIERIRPADRAELANQVIEGGHVSEDDAKN